MANKHKTCEQEIETHLESRIKDIGHILSQKSDTIRDIEGYEFDGMMDWLRNYTLSYEYDLQYRARNLMLSMGGPSDGFLFYKSGKIEYYYSDWWDSAERKLYDDDYDIIKKLYDDCLNF